MSGPTFEQLRIPAALILIIVVAFILLPRGDDDAASMAVDPSPSIIVGEPGGAVTSTATPAPRATPTPIPTSSPTPTPVVDDTFAAEVLACRSIDGSRCEDRLGTLPARAGTFTALVVFSDANAGDTISVTLTYPGGTVAGGPYTLGGGGDGYYYSTFTVGGLPGGRYVVTAYRNGAEIGEATFRRRG